MPNTIEQPVFVEGQVLSARDLNTISELSRNRDARHARHSHLWGIVRGLELSVDNGVLKIAPGVAIDSSGAELLVDEEIVLSSDELQKVFGPKPGSTVPVFIQKSTTFSRYNSFESCRGSSGQSSAKEVISVLFRENATAWDEQGLRQSMSQGEADGSKDPRPILLGFVKLKGKIFDEPSLTFEEIKPRYLGVLAESVVAVQHSLQLRGADFGTPNTPVIEISQKKQKDAKAFAFSMDDGSGNSKPVFTVDENGNVHAMGAISSELKLTPGTVLVQSGIATDGAPIPIPLPAGVSRHDPSIAVHIHVTPILNYGVDLLAPIEILVNVACEVDDSDCIRCVNQRLAITGGALLATPEPGKARYLAIVTVASKGLAT